jgi:hypothetical protein
LRPLAVRIAAPGSESEIASVPALKVLSGLTAWAANRAPEPSARPSVPRRTARVARIRFGLAERALAAKVIWF